jgi:hypothetical protein
LAEPVVVEAVISGVALNAPGDELGVVHADQTLLDRTPIFHSETGAEEVGDVLGGRPDHQRLPVQYLVVLLNSASHAARPTTSVAAYPRASGKYWRSRARPSQWSEWPWVM